MENVSVDANLVKWTLEWANFWINILLIIFAPARIDPEIDAEGAYH